jgi:hypothetical protein
MYKRLGGQFGCLYLGESVCFFIPGIYGEVDPLAGEFYPACIPIPTALLYEFRVFSIEGSLERLYSAASNGKSVKDARFKSNLIPQLEIATDFNRVAPCLKISRTLGEFLFDGDEGISKLPDSESSLVRIGEIAAPEAMTIGEAGPRLRALDTAMKAQARNRVIEAMNGAIEPDSVVECDHMVFVADNTITFILPPSFLIDPPRPNDPCLPPVAVPTIRVLALL